MMAQIVRGVAGLAENTLCLKDPVSGVKSKKDSEMIRAVEQEEDSGAARIVQENAPSETNTVRERDRGNKHFLSSPFIASLLFLML
jgi:hypothetical protein